MSIETLRICETCGEVIPRTSAGGYTTPPNRYAIRRFCDRACRVLATRKPADLNDVAHLFWAKVSRGDADSCWLWRGTTQCAGYGEFCMWREGRRHRFLAHRVAVMLTVGELPPGLVVMHTCDNPPCVNPAHLRAGTQGDNVRDALAKGRLDMSGLEVGQRMKKTGRTFSRRTGTTPTERHLLRRGGAG